MASCRHKTGKTLVKKDKICKTPVNMESWKDNGIDKEIK